MARAMLTLGGSGGNSPGSYQPASSISVGWISSSPPAYSVVKPIMSEFGNGQGWVPKYRRFVTSIPTSSLTSRLMASSTDSPGSTKPASTLYMLSGKPG